MAGWNNAAAVIAAVAMCVMLCATAPAIASASASALDADLPVAAADVAPEFDAQQSALLALYERTAADAAANNHINAQAIDAAVDEFTAMMEIKGARYGLAQ